MCNKTRLPLRLLIEDKEIKSNSTLFPYFQKWAVKRRNHVHKRLPAPCEINAFEESALPKNKGRNGAAQSSADVTRRPAYATTVLP